MKKSVILNIARTELKLIFTTPVACIMLMVFTVLCGLFFADVFGMYAQAQEGYPQIGTQHTFGFAHFEFNIVIHRRSIQVFDKQAV